MTMQYAYVDRLQAQKMKRYPTKVINIIGGPGCEKSFYSSVLALWLHQRNKTVEMVPDYAKSLVWQQDFEALKNQYHIAMQQHRMLSVLNGQVQFIINECSLPQLMYYNEYYEDNICDVKKTGAQIYAWHKEFDNVNLVVQRDLDRPYNPTGRFQDENKAREMDKHIRNTLVYHGIKYTLVAPVQADIEAFAATALT